MSKNNLFLIFLSTLARVFIHYLQISACIDQFTTSLSQCFLGTLPRRENNLLRFFHTSSYRLPRSDSTEQALPSLIDLTGSDGIGRP